VLPTILSRVQRLDLRRVDAEDIAAHVVRIVTAEGSTIEEAAVDAVVRAGDGSVRDTLSILEQVLAFAGGGVTAEHVAQVLGTTPGATITDVVDRLVAGDLAGLLATVSRLVDEGHDLRRFTLDLVGRLRDLLVLQAAPEHPELVDATREQRDRLAEQAGRLPREQVLAALETLSATVVEQRLGTPRLPLELALAQLTMPRSPAPVAAPAACDCPRTRARRGTCSRTRACSRTRQLPHPRQHPRRSLNPRLPPSLPPRPRSSTRAGTRTHSPAHPGTGAGWPGRGGRRDARDGRRPLGRGRRADPSGLAAREGDLRAGRPDPTRRGILTLSYGPRYASFHADQAAREDMGTMLRDALKRACSLDARIAVVRDGEDQRARPTPPLVSDPDGPTAESIAQEARDVAEADASPAAPVDPADIGRLLADRLDATPDPDWTADGRCRVRRRRRAPEPHR
jgi:hypothetical protein